MSVPVGTFEKVSIELMMTDVVIRLSNRDEKTADELYESVVQNFLDTGQVTIVRDKGTLR